MIDLSSGAVHYYFSDHLGSASVVTNATGTAIEQESDYYPYGGERILSAGANNYKFSSKERDSEWALDNFGARFYSSQLGRFMTGDWSAIPVPVPYATFENPQSLNLYMYRTPINAADLDGHAPGDQPLPDVKHVQGAAPEPNSVVDKGQDNRYRQSKTQTSSDGLSYKKDSSGNNIPHPATGKLKEVLVCTKKCTGKEFTVTSTSEPVKAILESTDRILLTEKVRLLI